MGSRACLVTALAAAASLTAAGAASAQTVQGRLLQRGLDEPVDLGLVMLYTAEGDSVDATLTDAQGNFRLSSPEPGSFLLAASGLGIRPTVASSVLDLGAGSSMSLDFRVEAVPIELEGITVQGTRMLTSEPRLVRNGFVDRVQEGRGRFIVPMDIEQSGERSVAALLQRTGRVTLQYTPRGEQLAMLGARGYCTPVLYVDGARVSLGGGPLDQFVDILSLEGAEVYRSEVEAPPEYAGGMSGCGVIVLWTRSR